MPSSQHSNAPAAYFPRACRRVSLHWISAAILAVCPALLPAETTLNITRGGGSFHLSPGAATLHYYSLEHSADLQGFSVLKMALGTPAPVFTYTPQAGEGRGFFRAQLTDVFSPGDADHDGIDDLWELQHDLDPLAAADALQPSTQDPARTNVEYYRGIFGLARITEFYSTETSVQNRPFAISNEASVYNFVALNTVHTISSEVSLYNFSSAGDPPVSAWSAEVSLFNSYGVPPVAQIHSDEVSVFNAYGVQPVAQVHSDEVSVFNGYGIQPTPQAISSEVSVFNTFGTQPAIHAISAEVSILKTPH